MNSTPDDLADDPRVLAVTRDYLAELEAGRTPDRRAYLARHPDLAGVVAECLDGLELAHAAGRALRPPVPPAFTAEPLGDFRIVREIGRGGMGIVYEAVQLSLGRRVALKVLPFTGGLDGRQLQRFQTEAHAAAQLHHTNIVPVYAVGCERGVHFYAMQLIDGRPLDTLIRELRGDPAGPDGSSTIDYLAAHPTATPSVVSPSAGTTTRAGRGKEAYRTAARIAAQVADALDYAHDAGVVHRDIKPANLLLDAKGTVWVTDFGLAQVSADAGPTRTGDVFGTLRYMSPEQAAGRRSQVDHRTDVYSLGATLYELLTLEPIFPGEDRHALLRQILNEEPRSLRAIDRAIPPELETIVLKAVAKTPEDRYATAGEMAADLRRFLDERPILARRPSLLDRGRKWLRRHPAYLAAAAVVLLFGVIGLAVSTALVVREKDRTELALKGEKRRAAEAEERFRLARRSADEMIQIADEELSDDPMQQTLRRRLLEAALAYYQEFIDQRRDDPEAQAELEQTRDRVRAILDDLAVMRGGMRHLLLREKAVQGDLKLTPAQRTQVEKIVGEIGEPDRGPPPREFFRATGNGRRQLLDEMKAHEEAIAAVLSPAQFRRLGQIALQVRGPDAFREPEVVTTLGLTREQRDRLRGPGGPPPFLRGGGRLGGQGPGGRPGREPRMDQFLDVLTPEQLARWKELTGEPYIGPRPGFGRGPGGPHHERP